MEKQLLITASLMFIGAANIYAADCPSPQDLSAAFQSPNVAKNISETLRGGQMLKQVGNAIMAQEIPFSVEKVQYPAGEKCVYSLGGNEVISVHLVGH